MTVLPKTTQRLFVTMVH